MPTLGKSPTDPVYLELLRSIRTEQDPSRRANRLRAAAEEDFWLFNREVLSFGSYRCAEVGHPHFGKPWIDHPWVFARCRQLQHIEETGESDWFLNWARFSFKTELGNKNLTLWATAKEPKTTTTILTAKIEQTGDAMFAGQRLEVETNPVLASVWPDIFGKVSADKASLTVRRPAGPKEPTISVHSLDHQPTSFHVDRRIVDDPVVRETVRNEAMIRSTFESMRQSAALSKDRMYALWIGTIWRLGDPWMLGIKAKMFKRDHRPCFGKDGHPVLHTAAMLEQWRVQLGPYNFAAQMLGDPVLDAEQDFKLDWLTHYQRPPREEAVGKRIYIVIDPRGGAGRNKSDFVAVWVVGRGEDQKTYCLDHHRERTGLVGMGDIVFDLVKRWRPRQVAVESYLHSTHYDYLKDRMGRESFRFTLAKLPQIKVPKNERIEYLISEFSGGNILLPAGGFGHGSRGDERDTMEQFVQDEYRLWKNDEDESAALNDDSLDGLAWFFQPQTSGRLFPFPARPATFDPERFDPHREQLKSRGRNSVIQQVSAYGW